MRAQCGVDLVCCLWLMELSNPFMHNRELFKEAKVANQTLLLLNDVRTLVRRRKDPNAANVQSVDSMQSSGQRLGTLLQR